MRKLIKNVITADEAASMVMVGNKYHTLPVMKKIKDTINKEVGPIDWDPPTYMLIEECRQHEWHVDTGSNNHMTWCDYGISILLNDKEESGKLEYRDGTKIDNYLHMAIHSSDVEHRVADNKGTRQVFLAFIRKA